MKHLDERVSDLVDDRLDHNERDHVLAHVAECQLCRDAVEYERAAKAALRHLPDVEPSAKLMTTLLTMAEPGGPLPPERPGFPVAAAPVAGWREYPARASIRPPRLGLPARGARYAAAGVLSLGGVVALLAAVGAPAEDATTHTNSDDATAVVPSLDEFTLEHARISGVLPFAEPASYLVPSAVGEDSR